MEGAERERPRCMCHDLLGLGDFQELDEAVGQLHDAVVGAPRMLVARADGEAEARIKRAGGIEVVHGVHDMVVTMGQGRTHLTDENGVGSNS